MKKRRLQVLRNSGYCDRRRCSAHDSLVQALLQRKATEARRRRSGGLKVDGAGRAQGFSSEVVGSFRSGTILDSPSKKRRPDRSWRCRKCKAVGNRRQVATRDAVQ